MNNIHFLCFSAIFISAEALAFDPSAIPVGEAELTPTLGVLYFSNDNIYAAKNGQIKSGGMLIEPEVSLRADLGLNVVSVAYKGEYKSFSDAATLDYSNHDLSLNSMLEFSSRSKLKVSGHITKDHLEPGQGLLAYAENAPEYVLDTDSKGVEAIYHYGSDTSTGGIEVSLNYGGEEYKDHPEFTSGHSYTEVAPGAIFLYAVSADTRITTGLEYSVFNHKSGAIATLDRNELFTFVGARWDVTGKSGGSLKVGYGRRNFTTSDRDDDGSFQMTLGAYWQPLEHSRINITAARRFAVDTGSPSINNRLTAEWRYDWSSRIDSYLYGTFSDYVSNLGTNDQTITRLLAGFDVSVTRWVALTFSAENINRETVNETLDFKKSLYKFGVKFSL